MPTIDGYYYYPINKRGYIEFEDIQDASQGYDECINLVLSQTRWVLDNMDYVKEFKVPWLAYYNKETSKKRGVNYAVSAPYKGKPSTLIN